MNRPIRTLDEALGGLDPTLDPPRDLWPGIAMAIAAAPAHAGHPATAGTRTQPQRRTFGRQTMALAAGIAVLGLVGSLAWYVRSGAGLAPAGLVATVPGAAPAAPAAAATVLPAVARFEAPDDDAYRAARAELERTFNERLALLAPATRERIEADLAAIRAANADIRAALAKDPASPLLQQLLGSTSQQEIDLYRGVARSTSQLIHRSTRT